MGNQSVRSFCILLEFKLRQPAVSSILLASCALQSDWDRLRQSQGSKIEIFIQPGFLPCSTSSLQSYFRQFSHYLYRATKTLRAVRDFLQPSKLWGIITRPISHLKTYHCTPPLTLRAVEARWWVCPGPASSHWAQTFQCFHRVVGVRWGWAVSSDRITEVCRVEWWDILVFLLTSYIIAPQLGQSDSWSPSQVHSETEDWLGWTWLESQW